MSEHINPDALREFYRELMKSAPNIMKGISDYGSFTGEENAQRYLEKLGVETVVARKIDRIFIKDVLGDDLYAVEDYLLTDEVSLWSLLESASEIAKQFGLKDFDDYKAGLVMRFDETSWLCLRLDVINPRFSGEEGEAEVGEIDETKHYEIILTSKPDDISWMGHNFYD